VNSFKDLAILIRHLSLKRRKQWLTAFALMLSAGIFEVATLGAVVPFLAVLASPDQAFRPGSLLHVENLWGVLNRDQLAWRLTLVFALAGAASSVTRIALTRAIAKLNAATGHELACEIFERSISQPYEVHVGRNSSEVVASLQKVDEVVYVLFSVLNLLSASVMALFVLGGLMFIDPAMTTITLGVLGTFYAIVACLSKRQLVSNSLHITGAYNSRIKVVQETLGGMRDVILSHTHSVFIQQFERTDGNLRQSQASNNTIGPAPRFAVEGFGMVVIAILGYALSGTHDGISSTLPILGAITLGMQRLLPMVQQVYQGYVVTQGYGSAISDVTRLLSQDIAPDMLERPEPVPFQKNIRFDGVTFQYANTERPTLNDVSFSISKGTRAGLIGSTGSGKTTTADLLMGLLRPTIGRILIDGRPLDGTSIEAWQRQIAHVPQSIFIADASFTQNIAFGKPSNEICFEQVVRAAQRSQLKEFIEQLPKGYETVVGELGVLLSGGQRQRLGIARALYKGARVLVFDEATSSLDEETEAAVIDAVHSLDPDITVVMIAHRLRALRECDLVIRLEKGHLMGSGSYHEMTRNKGLLQEKV
jgi:ATP-binding cassette, subfamily B, bacterial PglK